MWTPQSGFVSQLDHVWGSGNGNNDCFESSLLRYLRESGKLDAHGDVPAQLDQVSVACRGEHDNPGQGFTTFDQIRAGMDAYGLALNWTTTFDDARQALWSINWVNGIRLSPANYPPSWFSYEDFADHFVTWCPDGTVNDPLNPNRVNCRYDIGSMAEAFAGAYILPSTHHGEDGVTPPAPPPPAPAPWRIVTPCMVKAIDPATGKPSHSTRAAIDPNRNPVWLEVGALVVPTGKRIKTDDDWAEVRLVKPEQAVHGYVPFTNMAA